MKRTTLFAAIAFAGSTFMSCGDTAKPAAEETSTENTETTEEVNDAEATTLSVNAEASTIAWKGSMVGMYDHTGTIAISEGSLIVQGESITGGNISVDMTSMVPTDDNYDPEKGSTKEKLVGHLSAPDFFDVANYPSASFEITGTDEAGNITGNLTVRGITNAETVTDVTFDPNTGVATGNLTFNRQQYDVAYKMTVKDMVISNDISLNISLTAS